MSPFQGDPQHTTAGVDFPVNRRINLHFRIPYVTRWGQQVLLSGAGALLGNWCIKKGHVLKCHHENDDLIWELIIQLPHQPTYTYKYAIIRQGEDGRIADKWETIERVIHLHPALEHGDIVEVLDSWADRSHPSSILATSAFTQVIHHGRKTPVCDGQVEPIAPALGEVIVRFQVSDHLLEDGQVICLTGGTADLGSWQQDLMLMMTETQTPVWEAEIRIPYSGFPFTYKYAIRSQADVAAAAAAADALTNGVMPAPSSPIMLARGNSENVFSYCLPPVDGGYPMGAGLGGTLMETGEARVAALPLAGSATVGMPVVLIRHDGQFRRERLWRGAGVAVPVFSLRTNQSVGVGEFCDIRQLVDFADACGMRLIQILPINDTCVYQSWWDSYPYSTLSVFALHPLYVSLRALHDNLPDRILTEIEAARVRLDLHQVDYEETMATKLRLARVIFDEFGQDVMTSQEFQVWSIANSRWLKPYAAFRHLRDLFQTSEHWRWGALSEGSMELVDRLTSPACEHAAAIRFTYWLQYHLHLQLLQVSQYAASKRVVLKGDLPIGVDKRSVDTWMEPHIFRMDKNTGAPPDQFAPNGQNWGFPTYNWEAMATGDEEHENFDWFKRRLRHMEQYFHSYRIDHILGFFRIWEIPGNCTTGILGHFRPSNPIWRHELEVRGFKDMARLTEPYIRSHLLTEAFGKGTAEATARFFVETAPGEFAFRPAFASECAIQEMKVRDDSPLWLLEEVETTKRGLMRLIQNVVLLKDPEDKNKFYPRINLTGTSSFKELDVDLREPLTKLYDDYFYRRQDDGWRESALAKLPTLMATSAMLVCGEDLGFVPACVPPVMQELGLIGLRIQRMSCQSGREFNDPSKYPYLTVASPSCHDVATTRAWYEQDAERRERFFYATLNVGGPAPEMCTPDVVRIVVQQHLNSPSVLAIFPLQDLMALSPVYASRPSAEEIINDPTQAKHYWRFRIHVPMEELLADDELIGSLGAMVVTSERCSVQDLPEGSPLNP